MKSFDTTARSPSLPLLLVALFAAVQAGCGARTRLVREQLEQGRQAYEQGEILTAYRALADVRIEEDESLIGEYDRLLAMVTVATAHLIERWLEHGEYWIYMGDLPKALSYFDDLLGQLPPGDSLRKLLEHKALPVRERLSSLRAEMAALADQARRLVSEDRIEDARQKLLEASFQADENHMAFPLEHQRLLQECDRRLPGRLEELEEEAEPELAADGPRTASRKGRRVRRPRARSRRPRRSTAARPKIEDGKLRTAGPTSVVEELFRRGKRQLSDGRKVEAIIAFRRLLSIAPDHQGAGAELERLEPFRKQKIEQWMEKASEHFAREELDEAAPYYRKVLRLDPENLRAKEGWQMFLRLKELKKRQK